jgi:hypothetical protein
MRLDDPTVDLHVCDCPDGHTTTTTQKDTA